MDRDYYQKYYTLERTNWWFKVRSRIIYTRLAEVIKPTSTFKILNIGAATGASSEMLSKFGSVTSSEYDEATCTYAKQVLDIDMIQASITELPFKDESFDLVCAFDVVEHVEDDLKSYEEMRRVCKKGGHIAVTVPAFMSLWSEHDVINHHYRRYVKSGILALTNKTGLKTIYSTYFNSVLFLPVLIIRVLKNLLPKKKELKSDFELSTNTAVNAVLERIFGLEIGLLNVMRFPFGVSYLNISQK